MTKTADCEVPVFAGRIMVILMQLVPYADYSVPGSSSEFITNKFVLVTECEVNRRDSL
jgi:hypothetical protein